MNNPLASSPPLLQLQVPQYQRVHMTLVGCGGTGSHIASGLISLAGALEDRGTSVDLQLIDPDRVEQRNVGRQLFGPGDVGRPKAEVLADRLNRAFAARVGYAVRALGTANATALADPDPSTLSVVIGAVDNPAARAVIAKAVERADSNSSGHFSWNRLWWIDAGNENHSGQVAIGDTADPQRLRGAGALGMIGRLPAPHLVYPDLVATPKPEKRKARRAPSCAELAAAGEQGLMVNRMAAAWVLAMLDAFFRGDLHIFAIAFDLRFGGTQASVIDAPTIAGVAGLTAGQVCKGGKG